MLHQNRQSSDFNYPGPIERALPGTTQPVHRHKDWRLVLQLAGELHEFSLAEHGRFRRLDFIVGPAYLAHWNQADAAIAIYTRLSLSSQAIRRRLSVESCRSPLDPENST